MNVELTIKGEVEALRLEPGDRLLVTLTDSPGLTADQLEAVREAVEQNFPGHEVVLLHGLKLAVSSDSIT